MEIKDNRKRLRRIRLACNTGYGCLVMYAFRTMGTSFIAHLWMALNIVLLLILIKLDRDLIRLEASTDTLDSVVEHLEKKMK